MNKRLSKQINYMIIITLCLIFLIQTILIYNQHKKLCAMGRLLQNYHNRMMAEFIWAQRPELDLQKKFEGFKKSIGEGYFSNEN